MNDKKIKEIEQAVLSQYDNGRYVPLGSDGGVLQYIQVNIYKDTVRASITRDYEIAQIRRIWALTVNNKDIYDFTSDYYKLRK